MECTWDTALLQRGDLLPPELLQTLARIEAPAPYLQAITRASLDPRCTYALFAHCEDIFPHVCASLRNHGSLASAIAALGRIVPFAPHLLPYAERLLATERYSFTSASSSDENLLYLLGLFRLFAFDSRTFKKYVRPEEITLLLENSNRPTVYLAIRILQIYLSGADHWLERMVKRYLGKDEPENDIDGQWDDKIIDYRFLTLWEEDRFEKVLKLIKDVRSRVATDDEGLPRTVKAARYIPVECFASSTTLLGNTLLFHDPRLQQASTHARLVSTQTVDLNLRNIARALKSSQPLLLTGLAAAGKTTLIRYAAQSLGKLNQMMTLHLNEQSDAKMLIGIHTTGDCPGSFVWKAGVLTTAVQEGHWILIEDLDRAPNEIIGTLLPLIEKRELLIPNRKETIYAAQGFRIIATVRSTIDYRGEETEPLTNMLGARHWERVAVKMPLLNEWYEIATKFYPSLSVLLPQFMAVYERIRASAQRTAVAGHSRTGVLRSISPRDFLKWCNRVTRVLGQRNTLSPVDIDDIYMEAVDCFVGALPASPARTEMAAVVAEELHIDPGRRDALLTDREVDYQLDRNYIAVGRYNLPRFGAMKKSSTTQIFSTNPHTTRMLERVAAAVTTREPLLLVGETGVGKTAAVQHLAAHLGKKLVAFNLSQQSEAADLLGGFKPVSTRSLIIPMKDEFDELFSASFSQRKNQQFLELLGKQMSKGNWKGVCKIWQQALKMVEQQHTAAGSREGETPNKKRKVESKTIDFARWDAFAVKLSDMERRLAAGKEAFAFNFVEGSIVKAVRNGDWVLLDEINLASTDTLESIVDLFDSDSPSLLLAEAGNIERIDAHPNFRVFAAMNPATDVGKKDLPPGIRSRFTELYVESPDKDIKSLQDIVRSYLRHESGTDQAVAFDTSMLYREIMKLAEQNMLVDGAGQKPHFSLRTLTRTMSFAKYITPLCSLRRALYEGFQMSFLTLLDSESAATVQPLLEHHLLGKRTNIKAELQKPLRKPSDGLQYCQGYPGSKHWVRQGDLEVEEQPHYILTSFIRTNLENLVRAASTRQFPVLIQGPTSSGKTSMIEYLAKRTGHKFVRINNHEYTDLQEYLGTYISDTEGRLRFQEGVLVRALREGHWIVLDELNLAPTDVLEALNRLLDDNRELLVPETQEVVRPHENFMLFATQNPAGLYGGRKTLSRAFRNRFLELHFDDIPVDELQEILHKRTSLPESRCRRIVKVYRELSVLRQQTRLFEQKSFATLRDLFRWASRPDNDVIEQLASNGFMLLAERVRRTEERRMLKDVIEEVAGTNSFRAIDEDALYARHCNEIVHYESHVDDSGVVWTKAMRRLYVLVSRAIQNNEPVLLVGDTGCGKTTICQMLARAFDKELYTVNAHQNTETGDLIGSQRPVRNRAVIEANLRHQLLSTWLLQSLDAAGAYSTDSLLEAYDSAIMSLDVPQRDAHYRSATHIEVQTLRTRFKALFEWSDGALVHAMKTGSFFLLDEISLAEDSVLERINSVLEPQRSILLAEKGSLDSYVAASTGFQFFATMNPGGDYGKRELSPALRNRFTEIWVPPLNDVDDIREIASVNLVKDAKCYAHPMVEFAQWFNAQYNTSASSSISIRDILAWVEFTNAFATQDPASAVVNGASMVYIDTLGANPAGLMNMTQSNVDQERKACLGQLSSLAGFDAAAIYSTPLDIECTETSLVVGPFILPKREPAVIAESTFSFRPRTTKINAMRVVRALQLSKPVMLEGSPGVGKTALIVALAQAVATPLTRINLSEQTDLLDLFGSDVPVEDGETGTFAWRDAPFLRAMKNGEWVLLDEMNLASQSVLEGLNACLDHRGEVYIPELGQNFTRHPDFRLFAAQNPHYQGGGRKGLPASFVNRFTVVFADAFRSDDLVPICQETFPLTNPDTIRRAVLFVETLEHEVNHNARFGIVGRPWEFNLRDLNRWLSLASSDQGLLKSATSRDIVDFLFLQRFRSDADKDFVRELFSRRFQDLLNASDLFPSISSHSLQVGVAILPRNPEKTRILRLAPKAQHPGGNPPLIQSLMLCVQQRWPVVLSGSAGSGKTALIERVAAAVGAPVVTFTMNAETDVMDLLGGFEQADPHRQSRASLDELRSQFELDLRVRLTDRPDAFTAEKLSTLWKYDPSVRMHPHIDTIVEILESIQTREAKTVLENIRQDIQSEGAQFKWIDGLLIECLTDGKWLVLDNANLCSPSVLDRLNSLLEPGGVLLVNEHGNQDGSPQIIQPHPNFRIVLTLDPRYGELSRAMRNRAVELHLPDRSTKSTLSDLVLPLGESAVARFRQMKALRALAQKRTEHDDLFRVCRDHFGVTDEGLFASFERQLSAGLYDIEFASLKQALSGRRKLPPPPSESLRDFYQDFVGQLRITADFADVQTVHPLNNQALVLSSEEVLSKATSLALAYDACVCLIPAAESLAAFEANKASIMKMGRLERFLGLKLSSSLSQSNQSVVISVLKTLIRGLLQSFQTGLGVVPASASRMTRYIIGQICSFCATLLDTANRNTLDVPYLNSSLLVAMNITNFHVDGLPSTLAARISATNSALTASHAKAKSIRGYSCTTLWKALKPFVATTLEQLNAVLRFESALGRFDQACQRFEQPLQSLADLRISTSRALELAREDTHSLSSLADTFEVLFPSPISPVRPPSRQPHFYQAFVRLYEHFSVLMLSDIEILPRQDLAKLCILSRRPLKDSADSFPNSVQSSLTQQLRLIASTINTMIEEPMDKPADIGFVTELLKLVSTAQEVSLRHSELLQIECQNLGRIVASQTHLLTTDELRPLDLFLKRFVRKILEAISDSTADPHIQQLSMGFLSLLDTSVEDQTVLDVERMLNNLSIAPDSDQSRLFSKLHGVSIYLRTNYMDRDTARLHAANAWAATACVGLQLYIPEVPFDPALEPRLSRDIYWRQHGDITSHLNAALDFREALTGEPSSIRTQVLDDDLQFLGPEPAGEKVYRPDISQLPELQPDLDSLMQALAPLLGAQTDRDEFPMDITAIENVIKVRERLRVHYRAYEDFTAPIVGLLDCLLVAQRLAIRATHGTQDTYSSARLTNLVPFAGTDLDSWLDDKSFILTQSAATAPEDGLVWLAIVALRCTIRPVGDYSAGLRDAIQTQFRQFYTRWRINLAEEQRKVAAQSSSYKYRGEPDDNDPSQEELDEYFFSRDPPPASELSKTKLRRPQDLAHLIAQLHHSVFYPVTMDTGQIKEMMLQVSHLEAETPKDSSNLWPLVIHSIGALNSYISAQTTADANYDVYRSANVTEAKRLVHITEETALHFRKLQEVWPEHATPSDVVAACEEILDMSHFTPLLQILPKVEKLHATVSEWQKMSSREYSASKIQEEVISIIVRWRQLELSTWSRLLDREWEQCDKDASSWWYIAYEAIIAAPIEVESSLEALETHSKELLSTLGEFLDHCAIGEYSSRLRMLRGFEAELTIRALGTPQLGIVRSALSNLIAYYAHFEPKVMDALSTGRNSLEKDIRGLIQLASWKDRNVDILKQSAQSSRKKLLRLVRKYRNLLAQPVLPILNAEFPTKKLASEDSLVDNNRGNQSIELPPNELYNLPIWTERPDRYRNITATAKLILAKADNAQDGLDGIQRVKSFSAELARSITELQKETPAVLSKDNQAFVNHLKTRKRRLLADVLKDLRSMGFSVSMNPQKLRRQSSSLDILASLPDSSVRCKSSRFGSVEYEFHRFLSFMPKVRDAAKKCSDELTTAEVGRCTSLLDSVLYFCITQYKHISSYLAQKADLDIAFEQLRNLASCNDLLVTTAGDHRRQKRAAHTACLWLATSFCLDTLKTQQKLSLNDYTDVVKEFEAKVNELMQMQNNAKHTPHLPPNIVSSDEVTENNRFLDVVRDLDGACQRAISAHPELQPVISELTKWMDMEETPVGHFSSSDAVPANLSSWIRHMANLLDEILASAQGLETKVRIELKRTVGNAWLVGQQKAGDILFKALAVQPTTKRVLDLQSRIWRLQDNHGGTLASVVSLCQSLLPVLEAYYVTVERTVEMSCELSIQTSRLGCILARSFIQLAMRGFCSPSEQAEGISKQENSLENGTGLGEGEGAEDISKDVEDNEDLSEVAKANEQEDSSREFEDEKDAVDMADEEMDGEDRFAGTSSEQDDNAEDPSTEDAEDVEEEPGQGGSEDPSAVDEKMWDGAHEQEQVDKEADSGRGNPNKNDLTAAQEGINEEAAHEYESDSIERDDIDAGSEEVGQTFPKKLDQHTEQEQNLDLPEDINVDGNKTNESDESDDDLLENEQFAASEADEAVSIEDHRSPDDMNDRDDDDRKTTSDEAGVIQDIEQAENDSSDETKASMLMRDMTDANDDDIVDGIDDPTSGIGSESNERKDGKVQDQRTSEQSTTDAPQEIPDEKQQGEMSGSQNIDQEVNGPSTKSTQEETEAQFKQLGDALKQWYDQHRRIQEAQTLDQEQSSAAGDADMEDAQFQHLPNAETEGDAQALAAASADQSTALNEDQALQVNSSPDDPKNMVDGSPEENKSGENEQALPPEDTRAELQDSSRELNQFGAFLGVSGRTDRDVDMTDRFSSPGSGTLENMNDQEELIPERDTRDISMEEARTLWSQHEESTRNLALILTEHLRLILRPTQATKLRGDFRTGKRLNIKRIIPYIASSYKRDKIWMRRSVPSKRSYQVMLAIDDSKSMTENQSRDLAFNTLALVLKSMSMLEVGELSVVGFGADVHVAHDFSAHFNSEAGANILKHFTFSQSETNVANLIRRSMQFFGAARLKATGSASDLWQLQLIISDGMCQDHSHIRHLVRQAQEERIMIVFIIVDSAANSLKTTGHIKQSILDLQTAEFVKDASGHPQVKMSKYMDTFPFRHYLIVRDVLELPLVLAGALRQWFVEVVDANG